MNVEEIRNYCLNKKNACEETPFDEDTLVFKIEGKIFALLSLDENRTINLKCNPDYAIELREHYNFIIPGYHMNKKHWNTISYTICANELLIKMIDHSFNLIIEKLPKNIQKHYL